MMLTRPVFVFSRRLKFVVVRSSQNPFNSSGRMYYETVLVIIYFILCVSTVIPLHITISLNVFISTVESTEKNQFDHFFSFFNSLLKTKTSTVIADL